MIVLSKPYVSDVLVDTLRKCQVPILKADNVELHNEQELNIISEQSFSEQYRNGNSPVPLLCNSEDALPLISKNLPTPSYLQQVISLFKDKSKFREFSRADYPQFYFQTLSLNKWDSIDPKQLPYPIIVKPAAGYSSIGVFRVENSKQWKEVGRLLQQILAKGADMYSSDVINTNQLIIEQWIEGTEYAIDAYFDSDGTPVILNVFTHKFMDDNDLSDRIYYTSKYVLQEMLNPIFGFLSKLGEKIDLRLIPLHIEVRQTKEGHIIPVEINPLRFAGCGTTELGIHAYGINSYEYFFQQRKPDWEHIVNNMDHAIYSFFCAEYELTDNRRIVGIDHDGLKKCFQNILEYRIMPEGFNTFAVIFYRSETNLENHRLISLDLESYLIVQEEVNLHFVPAEVNLA